MTEVSRLAQHTNQPHNQPLVSIIIPAFNAQEYLGETIDSVLAQTYRPIEIIVIDDGSTDETVEIARAYGDPVVVIEQENRGPAGARNTGFDAARGAIIALLDADDQWMPSRLERCVDVLQSDPQIGFVTTDAFLIEEGQRTGKRYYGGYQRYPFPDRASQLEEIAKRNFVFVSAVFDRRLLDLVGGRLDERLWGTEDYDLWTRFVLAGAAAELIPEPLAWYRIRSDSVSRARERQWKAHLTVLEQHLPTLWLLGAHGRPQDAYDIGILLSRSGERRMATWFLFHALTDPGANFFQRARFLLRGVTALVAGQNRDAKAEAAK
ncbi:MAG: glycosyltransferase [Acidimicrobiia bacterium]|nr:glycosyltransferase [Acidimicrobiia bacterium]